MSLMPNPATPPRWIVVQDISEDWYIAELTHEDVSTTAYRLLPIRFATKQRAAQVIARYYAEHD
jgi:hypothetical protein